MKTATNLAGAALMLLTMAAAAPADARGGKNQSSYTAHYLVSDGSIPADNPSGPDPNLINAWGIVFNPFGPVWVAANGSATSTLYDGAGHIVPLVVAIPGAAGSAEGGAPTGIVFNGSTQIVPANFVVTNGTTSGPSFFLFATEQGTISGWAPSVDFLHAFNGVDNSAAGAIYKGLALSAGGTGALLYATDFHNARIDVFDAKFQAVQVSGGFADPDIPAGFAPFGIQAINGDIYVTYAQQDADQVDDVHGRGLGYVNVFDSNGNLLRRVASRGFLDAPWGLALAPAGFGAFSNRLLVGNFGDGRINAYDAATGRWVGTLDDSDRKPLVIDGLWGLAFGNGYAGQGIESLFFTAGPDDETHGAYGVIDAVPRDR